MIQEVGNKRKFTSPGLVRKYQKLNAVVERIFSDDINSTSIFSKVIGDKLFDSSSGDLYTRCRMNFLADPVQTQTPKFVDLGFSTINEFDETSDLSAPATIIQRPTDGTH